MSGAATKKKRKYFDRSGGKNARRKWSVVNRRPKRGAPGILFTCETGRERKCEREGLEILNHYHSATSNVAASSDGGRGLDNRDEEGDTTTTLSLEEELKLLKSKKGSSDLSAFGVYDTSCRGTIFVLCALSDCSLISAIQTEYMLSKKNTTGEASALESRKLTDNENDQISSVSREIGSEKLATDTVKGFNVPSLSLITDRGNNADPPLRPKKSPWDPISTVRSIMSDIDNDSNKAAPRSRFVTRMIPIQATCFASSEELQLTCLELLKRYVSQTTKTFAIVFKRRNCSNLNRNLAIKIVGEIMSKYFPNCKVQLDKPAITIMIEVCGTLCGVSVIENMQECRNFNLMGSDRSSNQK